MEQESKKDKNVKKVLAYVNIHKRTINLSELGFIEEIKSDLINMHSRRDYKVTLKGIEQLLPYFLVYPDEMKNMVQYMNKFKLDKKAFGNMLSNRAESMIKSMNLYIGSTTYLESLPLDVIQIDQLQKITSEFNSRLGMTIDIALDKSYEQLRHYIETNNLMITLNGKNINLSNKQTPNTREELAELARQNIEKLKKTEPRTAETIKKIESLITRSAYYLNVKTKSKTSKLFTLQIKN